MVPAGSFAIERLQMKLRPGGLGRLDGLENSNGGVELAQAILRPAFANCLIRRRDHLLGPACLKQHEASYHQS
jgi:hypothetical protein